MRWLLVVLLTLNGCYLLWMLLTPMPGSPVITEDIRISPVRGEAWPVVPLPAPPVPTACVQVGPFPDEDMRRQARQRWSAHVPQDTSRRDPGERLHRVYVSADDQTGTQVLSELREQLEQAGIDVGSFLITSGELAGNVSLGLFREPDNALDLLHQVDEAGVAAQIHEESADQESLWLELRFNPEDGLPVSSADLSGLHEDLQYTENLCETIAP